MLTRLRIKNIKRFPDADIELGAIANNEEIDSIHAEFAPKMEKVLAALNKAAKKDWKEWEVPRELPGHARPHPGPLPRGEGESHSALGRGDARRKLDAHSTAVPSPGGEGGRSSDSSLLAKQLIAEINGVDLYDPTTGHSIITGMRC